MNNIKVKLVEAHQSQLKNFDVKKELQSVQEYVNGLEIELENRTVFLVCIQGNYDDFGKRTNATSKTLSLHSTSMLPLYASTACFTDFSP